MAATPRHQKQPDRQVERLGVRAVAVAGALEAIVAGASAVGFATTGSAALLTSAVLAGTIALSHLLFLRSARRARRAAEGDHPLGYVRGRSFWAFIVAFVLAAGTSAFAVVWGIDALDDPEPLTEPTWALGAAGAGIVLRLVALRLATRWTDEARGAAPYRRFLRRATRPELPVVVLQETGALVASIVAAAGIGAAAATDDGRWDAIAALGIGATVAIVALGIVVAMRNLLIGTSASRRDLEAIRAAIEIEPDVLAVVHVRTEHLGPDELMVGAKVELHHELTVVEVAGTIERIERSIRTGVPAARVIYLEPDVGQEHRSLGFVAEHTGSIDPSDPRYVDITGLVPDDDPLWTE